MYGVRELVTDWLFTSVSLSLFYPFGFRDLQVEQLEVFFKKASVEKGIGPLEVPQRSLNSMSCTQGYLNRPREAP